MFITSRLARLSLFPWGIESISHMTAQPRLDILYVWVQSTLWGISSYNNRDNSCLDATKGTCCLSLYGMSVCMLSCNPCYGRTRRDSGAPTRRKPRERTGPRVCRTIRKSKKLKYSCYCETVGVFSSRILSHRWSGNDCAASICIIQEELTPCSPCQHRGPHILTIGSGGNCEPHRLVNIIKQKLAAIVQAFRF